MGHLQDIPNFERGRVEQLHTPEEGLSSNDPAEHPYRVDFQPVGLANLARQTIDEYLLINPLEKPESGLVSLSITADNPLSNLARYHESTIFKDEWYKNVSPEEYEAEAQKEFEPYEDASHFVLVFDVNAENDDGTYRVAGVTRMIDGSISRLKTVDDTVKIWKVSEEDVLSDVFKPAFEWTDTADPAIGFTGDEKDIWDYSSLAVYPEYRGLKHKVYQVLSHDSMRYAIENGAKAWTTIFVTDFFRLYTKFSGVPFRRILELEPKVHMNAESIPAILHFGELPSMKDPRHKNHRAPAAYDELVGGEGLNFLGINTDIRLAA